MNYDELAKIYDGLVKDDEATKKWCEYTISRVVGKDILELACGSAEITLALAKQGYRILASDLSERMIEQAMIKDADHLVEFVVADMIQFDFQRKFDAVICYCDSINYLNSLDEFVQMLRCVKKHLNDHGVFLFDIHSLDRLVEFEEEFLEEGILDDVQYQWSIQSDENRLYHHFGFWHEGQFSQENHIQTVFDPNKIISILENEGFEVEVMTDFDTPGINEGEKIFIGGKKI